MLFVWDKLGSHFGKGISATTIGLRKAYLTYSSLKKTKNYFIFLYITIIIAICFIILPAFVTNSEISVVMISIWFFLTFFIQFLFGSHVARKSLKNIFPVESCWNDVLNAIFVSSKRIALMEKTICYWKLSVVAAITES